MEREIANVAAACAMRGFRYMAFPPIVFEPMIVAVAPPEWEAAGSGEMGVADASTPTLFEPAPWPEVPAAIDETMPPPVPAPPPGDRHAPRPRVPDREPAPRRFALLSEVSAELRRQGPR